ncbi:MAG: maleylacetoacetate isomerase [Deltaproteobacteria bacterium]|nr:maleylacetoacetate isomerase [Deltaproteobacteria bacterium]
MVKLVLHNYWRSSASQRVRTALNLKQLAYEYVAVNIVTDENLGDGYRAKNPQAQVPTLEVVEDDGTSVLLTQSVPILEYLDERWPDPAILPASPLLRARARALAEIVNSGIQPHQNLPTLRTLKKHGLDEMAWPVPYIANGLAAYAKLAAATAGRFSVGDAPTVADLCLIPQLAAARRFGVDYSQHEVLVRIEKNCLAMAEFANATPEAQPDAPKGK